MILTTTTAKSGKINLYTDGEYRFSVPAEVWFANAYRDGDEIEEEELAALQTAADSVFAYEKKQRCNYHCFLRCIKYELIIPDNNGFHDRARTKINVPFGGISVVFPVCVIDKLRFRET